MAETSNFLYYDHIDDLSDDFDYIVTIDADFEVKREFLASLAQAMDFPPYFRKNWDALHDCLNDLSWIEGPRILLIHEDLPLEPTPDEAAQYLELIVEARRNWADDGAKILTLAFPAKCRERISELIGHDAY